MDPSRLNVVGCGRLGRSIAKLFLDSGLVSDVRVCNRSLESGEGAVAAIGAGVAHGAIREMPPSALWLVGCGDEAIPEVVEEMRTGARLAASSVVFHCSGVVSSVELAPLRERGCSIASAHPVRSFANTEMAVRDFAGTFCGMEGDERARSMVSELFSRVGGKIFTIPTEAKVLCHAGHVFASNYLVSLLKVAHDLYLAAGIPQEISWSLMEPLVRGTVDNIMRLGPAGALTGPIARGEGEVVSRQLDALARGSVPIADLYSRLGAVALEIARARGLSADGCRSVRAALKISE